MSDARHDGPHRRRTLTVLVDELAISDGQIDPPEVGVVTSFPLLFTETSAGEPDSVTVRGTLEPAERGPRKSGDGWRWSGLLRGDGWTATRRGRRPLTGRVELTGQFMGVMGIDADGWVRGRVTSVQVATMFWVRDDTPMRWAPVPRRREYRTVEKSPRFFSDERAFDGDPPALSRCEIGVLITLDLDDVPPLPLRPRLVAGDVAACGGRVWAIDSELPTAVRIDDDGSATTHLFPGPVARGRSVWATPSGCWISGPDGTYRVDAATEMGRRTSEVPATVGAVRGEHFLACSPTQPWLIHAPGAEPVEVDTPTGSPIDSVADGGSFVVLLRCDDAAGARRYRPARIAMSGTCHPGPMLPDTEGRHPHDPVLLGNPLRVAQDGAFTDITPDLTPGTTRHIPSRFFRAGAVGDHIWIIGHPPDRSSRSWWPLRGPAAVDRTRGQSWLLTIVDATTLEPLHVAPLVTPQPSVVCDDNGPIWLTARGQLQKIVAFGHTMAWPETVELQ
ncbi:hypothetical protein GDN83_11855 [Gordonia jinghuaiqii]|uniref:Uncharacterized protein n=1 Tax=Gordonia jinghuaiqii TaxID=2758710 RepID=A0A7D7R4I8_9ACTN|nr:hypothetical protein [Gordonia jinghuaiqii]MCR5978411.1 hypothetical protein [Gordonia jinghuaiqii]QMT02752.1 hypothetical protein H1R19_06340 [Gordonia jinghuaiqii]